MNNVVQKFRNSRKRKIIKAQWGWLSKLLNTVKDTDLAYIDNPSVMTAAGHTAKVSQVHTPTKDERKLANNLATIGEAAVTAPTVVSDIGALATAVRHPVQTGKAVWKAGQDALWFIRNPRFVKVYHGTPNKEFTNLKQSRIASENNIGVHVTPRKEIAESFVRFRGGDGAHVLEGYIPKHNMETIDIGANDYRLFSNNFKKNATTGQKPVSEQFGIISYDTHPEAVLEKSLYKKYGGNPSVSDDGRRLYLDNDVTVPLQKETWPNMPNKARQQMDKIISEGESRTLKDFETYRDRSIRLNQQAAKIASDNGKKVIKYVNTNPSEGGGGVSYMITDPKVFYNPQKYNWQQIMNRTKYPVMYGTNQ